jgi:cell division protein ZapB
MESARTETELHELSKRIAELVALTRRLDTENKQLRNTSARLEGEHTHLVTRNEQARQRIEAMIVRLKALEQSV